MFSLFSYHKCSTCQNAIAFLKENAIHFEIKEITLTPPSLDELQRMLVFMEGNLKKLFNTSGLLYRELKLNKKIDFFSQDEAFDLLSKNGMLVKRPFLIGDKMGLTGFHEQLWKQKLCV